MKLIRTFLILLLAVAGLALPVSAQRQMERLGRGVMVLHSSASQAYVGWRLLANDPADIGFNVYRVQNGGVAVKLNSAVITNTTDFLDTTANFTVTNYWYVRPVTNGVEWPASGTAGLPANSPVRQYVSLPLQPVIGGPNPPYEALSCFPADLDGDGEYDFVVLRTAAGTNGTPPYQFAQAYKRDGTLLWQLNAGPNSANQYSYGPGSTAISFGDSQHMVVYDMDGDGKAEVLMKTGNGVTTITPSNTVVSSIVAANSAEFISVFDGLTGLEKSRCTVTNPWPADGVIYGRFGIVYADGVRPTLIFPSGNRNDATLAFQEIVQAYDYRNGQITQRWFTNNPGTARGHQIRLADVNHDGKDDLVELGGAYNAEDGSLIFDTDLVHGDRYHTTDVDPDRPGLETYAIQQRNGSLLATALFEAGTGNMIKRWYSATVTDVGRGDTGDFDPRYHGMESFSTEAGLYDAKGNRIPNAAPPFPTLGIWWDADLQREFMSGAGSTLMSPTIDKWTLTEANPDGVNVRQYSIYNEGVHQGNGGRPSFLGDILGDWREETVQVADDYSELRIYSTKVPATNRLYCLMQNAAYRIQSLCKGYTQSPYTDYYLGEGMQPPCPPPSVDSKLVWRGNTANVWDTGTANWRTNWNYLINPGTNPVAYASGDSVLFDLTGSNHTAVTLSGTLTPGAVTVYSPKDYTFGGSGSLAGSMTLTKVGGGRLTLAGTNTFTGATTVWEGALNINGQLTASPVTVRGGVWLDGAIGGGGTVSQAVTLHRGASVSPGNGTNAAGALTLAGGLTLVNGAFGRFDLSDDPSGVTKTNDQVAITGNLTLTGTNYIFINRLNATLATNSVYPLIYYSGALNGSISNLVLLGLPGIPVALTNPPGQIALVVKSYPAPSTITWTGGSGGNVWDLLSTTNWSNGGSPRTFAPFDTVRFDNSGASNPVVTLVGDLNASGVVVDATNDFLFAGSGGIIGAASLTKTNSGKLTVSAVNNTFTGRTLIAGGTLEVGELDAVGFPSPLGNPPGGSTNLVLAGDATLRVTGESYTDRGATLNAGTNTIQVVNAADQVTIAGQLVGAGTLRMLGAGTLALTVSNSHAGGTIIKDGRISLGSLAGNRSGVGSGLVTLDGGRLSMMDLQGSETAAWNLFVVPGSTGWLDVDGRCSLTGSLTGGGTLTVNTPYVRTDFNGNWSAYTGAVNVITYAGAATFRWNNTAGLPQARLDVGDNVSLQSLLGGTPTVALGELSGSASASINAPGGNDGVSVRWSVGGLNTSATYAGDTANNVGFTKVGSGTWTLSGTLAHTGPTTVSNGLLLVNGNATAATGTFTAAGSGALGGTGVIGGLVTINNGAGLTPGGTNVGTLTISNQLVLGATSQLNFQLGASSDLVAVAGNLTLGGQLNVSSSGGFVSGTYTLFNYSGVLSGTLPTMGTAPANFSYAISTNLPGQVRLTATFNGSLPAAPLALTASPSNAAVFLNWTSVSNATAYNLKRATTNAGPFTVIALETPTTNFTDASVVNGATYYYVVTAVNGAGESASSPMVAVTPPGIPDVPTGLVAAPGDQLVSLDWNAAPWATSYNVKRALTNLGPYLTIATNVAGLNYDAAGLTNGTLYYFVVSAVNASGESSNSAPASATPVPLVIAYWTNLVTGAAQSWNTNVNWTNVASFPNGLGVVAILNANIAANQTNNLNTNITIGGLQIADANGTHAYRLAGNGGALVFDNGVAAAKLVQLATSKGDTIAAPINLNSSLVVSNLSTNTLTFTEVISGPGAALTVNGGRVSFVTNNIFTGGFTVGSNATVLPGSGLANREAYGSGKVVLSDGTLQFFGYAQGDSFGYASFTNELEIPAGRTGTLLLPPRFTMSNRLTGGGTLNLRVDFVRDDFTGNWSDFTGKLNVNRIGSNNDELRLYNTAGLPNARLALGTNVWMYWLGSSGAVVPLGEFSALAGALVGGQGNIVTWRAGGLNTDFTNAATIAGTTRLLKEGSGTWTLTGDNSQTGTTTVSNGTLRLLNPTGRPTGAGALTVAAAGTLSGNAQIDGPATIEGTLSPGTGSNTLAFNAGLTLGSGAKTILKVRRPPASSDAVNVVGTLGCGGMLVVTNVGTNGFVAGDIVTPVTATSFGGSFAALSLPPLDAGLAWDASELYTLGQLKVVSVPPAGSFEYQATLTFPGYNRAEVLTNIPLLVVLRPSLPGFNYAQFATADGSDLRFRHVRGNNSHNHQIDTWNTAGESRVWVRVPLLTTNTAVQLTWGNTAITNVPAFTTNGVTWPSNYVGVWHFTDGAGLDSTAGAHDSTINTATGVAGLIGDAVQFNGSSSVIQVPWAPAFNLPSNFEVQGWFNVAPGEKPAANNFLTLTAKEVGASFTNRNWWVAMRSDGRLWWKSSAGIDVTNSTDLANGAWHHFAAVHEGAVARLYVDGVPVAVDATPGLVDTQTGPVTFGNEDGTARYYKGLLDEMRISSAPRSSNWVWAVYQNIASNVSFSSLSPAAMVSITNAPPQFTSTTVLGGGGLRLTFVGPNGANYELRATTNLTQAPLSGWELLSTGTFGTAPLVYDDGQAGSWDRRFYVLRLP